MINHNNSKCFELSLSQLYYFQFIGFKSFDIRHVTIHFRRHGLYHDNTE